MSAFWFAGGFGELAGEGPVVDLARAELGADPVPDTEPAFRLEVRNGPAPRRAGPSFGGVIDLGDGCLLRRERMDLEVELRVDGGRVDAVLFIGARGPSLGIPRQVYPMVDRAGMAWETNQAYHVVTLMEVLALYNGAAAVLHSSVVESGGSGLALTSAGGVGKTSTACSLVLAHGFRHLADDIAMIDDGGCTLRSRRRLMIYPYNLAAVPSLASSCAGVGSRRARVAWHADRLLGLDRRRRRMSAEDVFGADRVAASTHIDHVAFLRRGGRPGVQIRPMNPDDLARRSNLIIESEFETYLQPLRMWEALNPTAALSASDVVGRNAHRLTTALAGSKALEVDIGPGADAAPSLAALVS